MKRYLSMILSVLLLLQVFCMTSFAADSAAQFALSKVSGKVGEIVEVQLSVSSTEAYNSVALHELSYDTAALKFVGFGNTDTIPESKLLFEVYDLDLNVITLGFKESNVLNGKICTLQFEILATAEEKAYPIAMTSLVKENATELTSSVYAGAVVVSNEPEELRDIYVEVTDGMAKPGEKFTVSVNVTENPGFNYMQLVLDYNADIMTLAGMGYAEFGNVGNNKNTYSWTNMAGDFTNIGTLMTLTFEVNTDAEPGIYKDAISVSRGSSGINDYGENLIGLVATPANVTIEDASCKHPNIKWHEPKDATCQLPGNIGYAECESCGGTFTTMDASEPIYDIATPINPKNHTGETYEKIEVDATATTEGYYGIYCKGCNAYLEKGETIPVKVVPTIVVGDVSCVVGTDTITVPVSIVNNPGIINMALDIGYDSNAFKLIEVKDSGLLSGAMHSDEYEAAPYTLTWANDTIKNDLTVNGVIVTLCFEILTEQIGEYNFTIGLPYGDKSIKNLAGKPVDFYLDEGVCSIKDYILGDVDGDMMVTPDDRTLLARYLAKWSGYTIDKIVFEAADIDGDGLLTPDDRTILARHLAKWSGYKDLLAYRNKQFS